MLKRFSLVILSLSSGVLLSLAWYWHLTFVIFFAWLPLLILEDRLTTEGQKNTSRLKLFGLVLLTFFTWNIAVTWWVAYASVGGAAIAFFGNTLLMSLVFFIFSKLKNRFQNKNAIWILIPVWLAWEHLHSLWDLTWTWLTLGNVFAFQPNWVQWYELTGTSGGSLWILSANVLLFQTLKHHRNLQLLSKPVLKLAAAIIVPVFCSYLILFLRYKQTTTEKAVNVVVVQPNIDPYNDKFSQGFKTQFLKSYDLVKSSLNQSTDYLVFPETFITENLNEDVIQHSDEIAYFRDSLCSRFPHLTIVVGASSYKFYKTQPSSTARKNDEGFYYDMFNTALQIDAAEVQSYHKSKLVPGVERMPFPALLKPLEKLAINMGGTMGSLGLQSERDVFKSNNQNSSIAPVICYESVYSDYVTEYVRKGAQLIFIITNDGWWDDTPGYKQHLNYARLRAIENRRDIARSANTGISCFIDKLGNISQATSWWKEAVISAQLYPSQQLTFFSKYGDLVSYTSACFTLLLLFYALFLYVKSKKFSHPAS